MKTKFLVFLLVTAIACISCKTKTTTENTNTMTTTLSPDYAKIIIAKVFIKPGSEADFIATAQSIIEKSNSEEGCLFYQLYQDPYASTNFIFVERYKNQAAVDFHFGTTYFKEFGGLIGDMVSQPADIKVIDVAGEVTPG